MTKFPKKTLPSSRRCQSSGRRPTFELIRPLKKKSRSNGPAAGRTKKKFLRRIVKKGAEMDTEDLLQSLAPYANIQKKVCDEQMERSEESDIQELNEKVNCSTNRIHKPRVYSRVKVNNSEVKMLKYKSNRNQIVTPCFDEDVVIYTAPELKNMYHKGVKEEDQDSTDSFIQMGIEKAMKHLMAGINSPSIRRKVLLQRHDRAINEKEDSQTIDYSLRLRTRLNSPQTSSKLVESRSSNFGSSRFINLDQE